MRRGVFAAAVTTGFLARIALLLTSIGTNDVVFFDGFAKLIARYGIAGAYAHNPLLNHPPLSLLILRWLSLGAVSLRVETTDLLRLMQSASDVGSAVCLFFLARAAGGVSPRAATLFYFLSPAAIFVSGFHGNTDPTMVFFILLAILLHLRGWPAAAGAALALATGIKIVPIFVVPLFTMWSGRWRFASAFAAVCAVIFVPAIAIGGAPVVRNIFGYAGWPEWWGVPAMLVDLSLVRLAVLYVAIARYAEILAVALVCWWFAAGERNAMRFLAAAGATYLAVLVLAPGLGVQYLIWPLPFLPFLLSRRPGLVVNAAASVLTFLMYTSWSRGFPWWYADSMAHPWPFAGVLRVLGYALWVALLVAWIQGMGRLRARGEDGGIFRDAAVSSR